MELTLKVLKTFALNERSYTDRNGQNQIMASRGIVLTNGLDTIYAEIIGDRARTANVVEELTYRVQLQVNARQWEDKNNQAHYSNDFIITRMA